MLFDLSPGETVVLVIRCLPQACLGSLQSLLLLCKIRHAKYCGHPCAPVIMIISPIMVG